MLKITPTNETMEEEGAWGEYRGVKLRIARANNPKYRRAFRRLTKPLKKVIEKGNLSDQESESIICQCMSEAILLDWDPKTFPTKEPIPYSNGAARDLLMSDPDCRDYVGEFSDDLDNYIVEDEKDTAKEQ